MELLNIPEVYNSVCKEIWVWERVRRRGRGEQNSLFYSFLHLINRLTYICVVEYAIDQVPIVKLLLIIFCTKACCLGSNKELFISAFN